MAPPLCITQVRSFVPQVEAAVESGHIVADETTAFGSWACALKTFGPDGLAFAIILGGMDLVGFKAVIRDFYSHVERVGET